MSEGLAFALERVADESRPVRTISLSPLSDVPRTQTDLFRATWLVLSPSRRLELIAEMVEQAETNVRLNFGAILRQCLSDDDPRVRKLAIEGLWEDNRSSLVVPLVALLSQDPAGEVRAAAAISLGRYVLMGVLGETGEASAAQAVAALRSAWYRPLESVEVRRRALEGLAYTGESDVRELIRNAYYDESEAMRQSAVFAMGRSADGRWSKYVLRELGSREAAMRFEAVTAAGELGLVAAVSPLIQLLDDLGGGIREAAALSLGQIGGPQARRALEACLKSDDERLVEASEEALAELNFNSGTVHNDLFDFSKSGEEDADFDEQFIPEDEYGSLYEEDDDLAASVDDEDDPDAGEFSWDDPDEEDSDDGVENWH